jgi:hypothetical protein
MSDPSLGVVDRVLRFVDRPWKIAAVVILLVAAIVGLTLWEKRAELAEAVLQSWVKPQLLPGRFAKISGRLMAEVNADLVVLAAVSVRTNLITNVDGVRRADPAWQPSLNPRPLYGAIRDPVRYTAFIEARPVCHDLDPADGEEERAEAALGIKRRCYIAVPPVLDALVGILAIGWQVAPSPEAETGATSLLWQAASNLATW